METVRRKPSTNLSTDQEPDSPVMSSAQFRASGDPEFKYGVLLLLSISFPLGVILAFGGKTTLITICFGGIIAYIFDLLGSIEVWTRLKRF